MDKQLAGLDPKIQETYHRVMSIQTPSGNPVPPVQNPQSPPVVPQSPIASPIQQTPPQFMPAAPEQSPPTMAVEKEEPVTITIPTPPPTINEANSQVFNSKKKAGQVSPIIMIMGVMIFFAVYTLVWVKIFNARLPFLP